MNSEVMQGLQKVYLKRHQRVTKSQSTISACLTELGQYESAEQLLRQKEVEKLMYESYLIGW